MPIITQEVNGLAAGTTTDTSPNARDEGHSHVHATSVYAHYHEGKNISRPKDSDDKITVGYNWQGLPFKIVVDGFFGGETQQIFRFIDNHVVKLMDNYATQLSKADSEEKTKQLTQQLISTIYKLRNQYAPHTEFTMSIAMTYEKDGAQYCAGFGIGDTGLVLHRATPPQEVIQLAKNIFQADGKDGFDNFTSGRLNSQRFSIESLSERNSIFNVEVHPGDEIIGYTHLSDLESRNTDANQRTISELKTDEFDLSQPLYPQIIEKNKAHFDARCQRLAGKSGEEGSDRFGDDCMISGVIIPTHELQEQLLHPEAFHLHNMNKQDEMGYDWQFRISIAPFCK